MTIGTQEHALLSDHAYGRDAQGNVVDLQSLVGKTTVVGGVEYRVLDHSDKASGYQGTIYQRVDSGEIVVAHRGTEFDRERLKDLVLADGGMVLGRNNRQADDAIALTTKAIELAKDYGRENSIRAPEVTVTGHSLGGTLAQVSGHYHGLKGETFNAFGAASLNVRNPTTGEVYRIPEGGDAMLNHVMAADLVSSGSPQYGQVRFYATQREIDTLDRHGYENNRSRFDVRSDLTAAYGAMSGGSHDMNNFLPWNGDHRRDTSVLADPATQQRAAQYDPMIDKFRDDIHDRRAGATVLLRSGRGLVEDVIEHFQDPLPAGEPARRAQEAERNRQHGGLAPQLFDGAGMYGAAGRDASLPSATQDPMFARFRESLPPGTPDDKVAQLVLQTRQQASISDASGIAAIQTSGSEVFVMGTTPGFRARLDLAEPAPPMAQTQAQALAFEQQQAQSRTVDNPVQARTV